jgi:hypothetical protein
VSPVAMPTRAASVSPVVVLSVATAAVSWRPARTAGSASKHTVPEELGDMPLKARDLTGHGF